MFGKIEWFHQRPFGWILVPRGLWGALYYLSILFLLTGPTLLLWKYAGEWQALIWLVVVGGHAAWDYFLLWFANRSQIKFYDLVETSDIEVVDERPTGTAVDQVPVETDRLVLQVKRSR